MSVTRLIHSTLYTWSTSMAIPQRKPISQSEHMIIAQILVGWSYWIHESVTSHRVRQGSRICYNDGGVRRYNKWYHKCLSRQTSSWTRPLHPAQPPFTWQPLEGKVFLFLCGATVIHTSGDKPAPSSSVLTNHGQFVLQYLLNCASFLAFREFQMIIRFFLVLVLFF